MKREHLLIILSAAIAVAVSVGLLRWLAPQLLGFRSDQIVVQAATAVPPFYDGVFRRADYESTEFLLQDPHTSVRGHPLLLASDALGPHDLLGFRNLSVPHVADVVVIGDSQTYGNNAMIEENWPSQMADALPGLRRAIYAMATGGWGAVQYLDMAKYAATFRPRVMVVAYYTGNDSLEAFKIAYNVDRYAFLRPDSRLSARDQPKVEFPAPASEHWPVRFPDDVTTVFTPGLRLVANDRSIPAVEAGYAIVDESARLIAESAGRAGIRVVFTVIPTKEFVYAKKVEQTGVQATSAFSRLIAEEGWQIERLARTLGTVAGATYVDLVAPLQQAAAGPVALYPANENGHPVAAGYEVIGRAIAKSVEALLPRIPLGPVFVTVGKDKYLVYLVTPRGAWLVPSEQMLAANGWQPGRYPALTDRDIASLPRLGIVTEAAPERFGPASLR